MKKKFFISIILIIIISIFITIPSKPELKIISSKNNTSSKASINGWRWTYNKASGNSNLGVGDFELASDINAMKVTKGTKISIETSMCRNFTKRNDNIEKVEIYFLDTNSKQLKEVDIDNYELLLPNEEGVYSYAVEVYWDKQHHIRYVFKIQCI